MEEIPITEARHELTSLPRRLARRPDAIAVTRRGKAVLAILPWDFYRSILETLEVMADPELTKELRKGIREEREGKGVGWDQAKKGLGL